MILNVLLEIWFHVIRAPSYEIKPKVPHSNYLQTYSFQNIYFSFVEATKGIYIYIYVCVCVCVEECIFRQHVIKASFINTMEHCLSFFIVIFQVILLFFLCRDPDDKGIIPFLLSRRFCSYYWSSSGMV